VGAGAQPLSSQTPSQPPTAPLTFHADTDKRGTDEMPLVMKVLPTQKPKSETEQQRQDRLEKANSDWWVVKFTGALAVVGFLQFIAIGIQAYFLWLGFREAKKAGTSAETTAKAAKATADAMVSQLRAYVSMKVTEGLFPHFDPKTGPWCSFEIRNTGLTPAFEMVYWMQVGMAPPAFEGPFPDGSKDLAPFKITLAPQSKTNIVGDGPIPLPGNAEKFATGQLAAFFYGGITYVDAFANRRFHNFRYILEARDFDADKGFAGIRICQEGNEAN
jgi:hypothetical protein